MACGNLQGGKPRCDVTEELKALTARVDEVTDRMGRVEDRLDVNAAANGVTDQAPRWQYLVARPHRWRRQLCIKGRNMTVGQLVGTLRANRMTAEQAAENLDLPLAAIYETLT